MLCVSYNSLIKNISFCEHDFPVDYTNRYVFLAFDLTRRYQYKSKTKLFYFLTRSLIKAV